MWKLIIIVLFIASLAGAFFYLSGRKSVIPDSSFAHTVNIAENYNNQAITASVDNTIVVTLKDPGTEGYTKMEPQFDSHILKKISHDYTPGVFGVDRGVDKWTFQCIGKGQTPLIYEMYKNDNQDNKTQYFRVDLTIN